MRRLIGKHRDERDTSDHSPDSFPVDIRLDNFHFDFGHRAGPDNFHFIFGNRADNFLVGNDLNNFIFGGAGNDTILGRGGNDFLVGGRGDDRLEGDLGNDIYTLGPGNDVALCVVNGSAAATFIRDLPNYQDIVGAAQQTYESFGFGPDYLNQDFINGSPQGATFEFFNDFTIGADKLDITTFIPWLFTVARGGPGCLNRFSASISGVSAEFRLPRGAAAG
jgi:hypothetical protein